MRLRKLAIVATASALFAGTGTSALAHEGHGQGGAPAPSWKADRMHHGVDPHARDAWMAECERRLDRGRSKREAREECAAFLDDYYARYRGGHGYAQMGYGYGYRAQGYGMGCCQQPMMMVPIVRRPVAEPECTETVEYEYVDVPVRAQPRPVPQKRVKVVPDKRVKVVPDKRIRTK